MVRAHLIKIPGVGLIFIGLATKNMGLCECPVFRHPGKI